MLGVLVLELFLIIINYIINTWTKSSEVGDRINLELVTLVDDVSLLGCVTLVSLYLPTSFLIITH